MNLGENIGQQDKYADDINAEPTGGVAVGGGLGGEGWKISVELLLPAEPGSIVGQMVVGTSTVGGRAWLDVTGYSTGFSVDRGAGEFAGAHDAGVGVFEFESIGHQFAPWLWTADSFHESGRLFRPGLPIRVAASRVGEFVTLWTGTVESWSEHTEANGRQSYVSVVAAEAWALLSAIGIATYQPADDLGNPADLESIMTDLVRLSEFPYPLDVTLEARDDEPEQHSDDASTPAVFDDTVSGMVVDFALAVGCWARTEGDGTLRVGRPWPNLLDEQTSWTETAPPAIELDTSDLPAGDTFSTTIVSSIAGVANRVTVEVPIVDAESAASNPVTAEDRNSIRRYGASQIDLDLPADISTASLIAARMVELRKNTILQLDRVGLDDRQGRVLFDVDLGSAVTIDHTPPTAPTGARFTGFVRHLKWLVSPLDGESAVSIDVEMTVDVYGVEQLDPNAPPVVTPGAFVDGMATVLAAYAGISSAYKFDGDINDPNAPDPLNYGDEGQDRVSGITTAGPFADFAGKGIDSGSNDIFGHLDERILVDAVALVYLPASLTDGVYGLWSNGGTGNGQGAAIEVDGSTVTVGMTNYSSSLRNSEVTYVLTGGVGRWYMIGTQWNDTTDGTRGNAAIWVDGVKVATTARTSDLKLGGGNGFVGDTNGIRPIAFTPAVEPIENGGLLIAHWFADNVDNDNGVDPVSRGDAFYTATFDAYDNSEG